MGELITTFNASPDGVMTNEVGVISGELELRSTCDEDGVLELAIRYVGAEEWYTIIGQDYRLHDVRDHALVHRLLITVLARPTG